VVGALPGVCRHGSPGGFETVAKVFEFVAVAEKLHEQRYLRLLDRVQKGEVFARGESVTWYCRNCGYVHDGREAPRACPACAHPQSYFQVLQEM